VEFRKSVQTDVVFFLLDAFNVFNLITVLFSFGICHVLARYIYEATHYDLILNISNPVLQFTVLFVIVDLKNYFSHFLFHKYQSLWRLHEFHHSATEFCMLTRYRGHFLEVALKRFIDVIPFAIFGASIESYFIIKAMSEIHQIALHSGYKSDWGWIGKFILVSPAAHWIHHSVDKMHYDKNFGNTFIVWDRLFRTYHPAEKKIELGVTDNAYNQRGVVKDVVIGYRNFFTSLFKGKSTDRIS